MKIPVIILRSGMALFSAGAVLFVSRLFKKKEKTEVKSSKPKKTVAKKKPTTKSTAVKRKSRAVVNA